MMENPSYHPADVTKRFDAVYTLYQDKLWWALADTYYARAYGFESCRRPSIDFVCKKEDFQIWCDKIENMWAYEASQSRGQGTRGLSKIDFSQPAFLYLYERMLAAKLEKEHIYNL